MKRFGLLYRLLLAILALASPAWAYAQTPFPNAVFLLNYSAYNGHPPSDYRPSIDPSGTRVIYERTLYDSGSHSYPTSPDGQLIARLYVSDLRFQLGPDIGLSASRQLYTSPAYRADWCAQGTSTSDGLIAFSTDNGIFVVNPDVPGSARALPKTAGLYYPAWYPRCTDLAVKQAAGVNGGPSSLEIDARTGKVLKNLSGQSIWAGFVSVNPVNPQLIVFAGQPVGSVPYNEDKNYVYLAAQSRLPLKPIPLDPRTPQNGPFDPRFQGRAPTFSPDGSWVAFESNRPPCNGSATNYALFIQRVGGLAPARQVTDCSYNAQHARWIPSIPGSGQTILIAAAWQPGISPPAFGVAAFDISAFLTP